MNHSPSNDLRKQKKQSIERNKNRGHAATTQKSSRAPESQYNSFQDDSNVFTSEMFDQLMEENDFYLHVPLNYIKMLNDMAHFNCGVILFKHRFWDQAIKFWKITLQSTNRMEIQIPLLYNLSIVYFLNDQFDNSLDICQDLIREICIYLTEDLNF